jgi:hypothetical protein
MPKEMLNALMNKVMAVKGDDMQSFADNLRRVFSELDSDEGRGEFMGDAMTNHLKEKFYENFPTGTKPDI